MDVEGEISTHTVKKERGTRFEYEAGKVKYKGVTYKFGILSTDKDWFIEKYTWVGADVTVIEGPIKGSWDNRDSLGWI